MLARSCSWCHSMVGETENWCPTCGHQNGVPRLDCRCPRCAKTRCLATCRDSPTPLAGLVAEVLAGLRPDTSPESDPAGESCATQDDPPDGLAVPRVNPDGPPTPTADS